MNKRILAVGLIFIMLLSGCSLLNRSYSSETPHNQVSKEEKNSMVLQAGSYDKLVSAILSLVSEGKESGTIRLYDYSGDPAHDLEKACLEIEQNDPLGAYAVDYIKRNIIAVMSYYEVEIERIVYKKSREQIAAVVSVTGDAGLLGELRDAMDQFQEDIALRFSSFNKDMTKEQIAAIATKAYYDVPESAFGKPGVNVMFYPEEAEGPRRLVEIMLEYPEAANVLIKKQQKLLKRCDELVTLSENATDLEKIEELSAIIKEHVQRTPDSAAQYATTYSALVDGEANAEGLALGAALLLQKMKVQFRVVQGSYYGKAHFWNIVQVNGKWQHLDLSLDQPKLKGYSAMRSLGYSWDERVLACPG